VLLTAWSSFAVAADPSAPQLTAVPFTKVKVEDAFWAPRITLNRERIVPHDLKFCETTGRINNFAKAAGTMPGKFQGIFFDDSDVYKVIEGAAYSLAQQRDSALEQALDSVIDKIAAAQLPDGYLYTYYTVNKTLDQRWTKESEMHETYCAGHLFEATVAYYQAPANASCSTLPFGSLITSIRSLARTRSTMSQGTKKSNWRW
jgi:DUF1680 family protein